MWKILLMLNFMEVSKADNNEFKSFVDELMNEGK
jgi:hypothetical protein